MRKKSPLKIPPTEATKNDLQIIPVNTETDQDTIVYYANYVEVAQSANEFALSVARMPTKITAEMMEQANEKGVISAHTEIQILLPPMLIPSLIKALNTQLEYHESHFGKIKNLGEANE